MADCSQSDIFQRVIVTLAYKDWERIQTLIKRDIKNRDNVKSKTVRKYAAEPKSHIVNPAAITFDIVRVNKEQLSEHERQLYQLSDNRRTSPKKEEPKCEVELITTSTAISEIAS